MTENFVSTANLHEVIEDTLLAAAESCAGDDAAAGADVDAARSRSEEGSFFGGALANEEEYQALSKQPQGACTRMHVCSVAAGKTVT